VRPVSGSSAALPEQLEQAVKLENESSRCECVDEAKEVFQAFFAKRRPHVA